MQGATGVLINITGGNDMTLYEVDEAATRIKKEVSGEANIIIGAIYDETLEGAMRVSVVATGIDTQAQAALPEDGPRLVQLNPSVQPDPEDTPEQDEADAATTAEVEPEGLETQPATATPAEEAPAAAGESKLPRFLEPPAAPPRDKTVTKRRQSFLDRVLRGGKTKSEAEPKTAASIAPAPGLESEPKPEPVIEATPDTVVTPDQEVAQSEPVVEDTPRIAEAGQAEMKPLMMEEPVREEIQAPMSAGPVKAELELAEPKLADDPVETPAPESAQEMLEVQESVERAEPEPDLADIVEKVQQTARVNEAETAAAPLAVEPVETVEPPAVSDITAPEPQPVQTTVQTTMSTGSFDDAQLDIPAFLKRGQ